MGLGVRDFMPTFTWMSYCSKSFNFGPLELFCNMLIDEVTAFVYSLTAKDLCGTIMPTCYMRKHELVKHESKTEPTLKNLYLYWNTLNIIKDLSFISEINHTFILSILVTGNKIFISLLQSLNHEFNYSKTI